MNLSDRKAAIDAWIDERNELLSEAVTPTDWWDTGRCDGARLKCGCAVKFDWTSDGFSQWKEAVWKHCDEHAAILGED
jgi:hypothetical protein